MSRLSAVILHVLLLGTSLVPSIGAFVAPSSKPMLMFPSLSIESPLAPSTRTSFPQAIPFHKVQETKSTIATTISTPTSLSQSTQVNDASKLSNVNAFSISASLSTFTSKYSELTQEHYLVMAFLQAGVLASSADIATQTLEGMSPIYTGHVLAMATVASTMSGAMNAIWLRQLEATFPGTAAKEVATKTLIHATIIAFIINSAYLVGVPLFSEYLFPPAGQAFHLPPMDLEVLLSGWSLDEFITLTKLEICMFIPYNTLAFKFIPPSIRPLTHALISATFNVAVSAVTLGYFDKWVNNAMHVLGQ